MAISRYGTLYSPIHIGYEPADLTVTPPPRTAEGGFIFSYRCLVFQKNVLRGKPVLFGVIQVNRPQNGGFSL